MLQNTLITPYGNKMITCVAVCELFLGLLFIALPLKACNNLLLLEIKITPKPKLACQFSPVFVLELAEQLYVMYCMFSKLGLCLGWKGQ